ncbi:HpcH/HpaI aldolase/citrate lyase family protein [Chloroflexota bacterium]
MRKNRIKEKIRQGKLSIGTYVKLADPALVEIIGLAGFDAAFIDMEHTSFDLGLIQEMIRACDIVGITSLVRVPNNSHETILRVLEMGAQGIQVPHISDKEGARAAVRAVRYAPLGERGMGAATRAAQYGAIPLKEHVTTSNSEIILAVMVEDIEAVRHLEDIAAVEGIDLVAIGPADLTQSLGIADSRDPKLKKTIEEIALTLKRVGKARMTFPLNNPFFPLNAAELQRLGVAYANCGPPDVRRLLDSYRQQVQRIQAQL